MAIKIIVADLDGTLMSGDHMTISEKTKAALLAAHNMGIKIAIATGRTLAITKNVTDQAPFIDYVIYSNGACVYDRRGGSVLYSKNIANETAGEIIDFIEQYPVFYDIYKGGCPHAKNDVIKYYNNMDLPQEFLEAYMHAMQLHDSVRGCADGGVEKINIFSYAKKYAGIFADYLNGFDDIDVSSPAADSIEITHANANKGKALGRLCAAAGICQSEAMAFGDSENDISMLTFAGWSFAMQNACQSCKSAAKYETLSNVENGIAAAVNKYILNEKQG